MVFTDLFFLYIFLPLNLILYYSFSNLKIRNFILIAFSLFFYSWGEPLHIMLLIFGVCGGLDFVHGQLIEAFKGKLLSKLALVSSIILNLTLLSSFKYADFFIEIINNIFNLQLPPLGLSLPIGISFYTFQTLSYIFDVYNGEVKAQKSFPKFLMFISLYHQLVAGPIVRYTDIENDINNRKSNLDEMAIGVKRIITGVGKKVIIANMAGLISSSFLNADPTALSIFGAWFGIILFTIQIFFDFSGYSDIAIGLGLLFGFHYKENFNYPYISKSVSEFWRRWHISLGSFFRDYIYIPLGGNRRMLFRNLLIVWFVTGLWHGASVNFIVWGLYFGAFIAIERLFLQNILNKLPSLICHLYLLLVVIFGWVIFYFEEMPSAVAYMKSMLGLNDNMLSDISTKIIFTNNIYWIIGAAILCTPLLSKIDSLFKEKLKPVYFTYSALIYGAVMLLSTALLVGESYNPFLYFRF